MSGGIEELQDVASQFPDIIKKVTAYAKKAASPVWLAKVVDASPGFKGYGKDWYEAARNIHRSEVAVHRSKASSGIR